MLPYTKKEDVLLDAVSNASLDEKGRCYDAIVVMLLYEEKML